MNQTLRPASALFARRALSALSLSVALASTCSAPTSASPATSLATRCAVSAQDAADDAQLDEAMAKAIEAKDVAQVKALLEQGAGANGPAAGGQTFLMRAIVNEMPEATQALLGAGANPEVGGNASGETPLFVAALQGQDAIIDQLLGKGADVNAVVPGSELVALHGAVYGGYAGALKKLLAAGANPAVRGKSGKTPLEVAEQMGNAELAQILREHEPGAAM